MLQIGLQGAIMRLEKQGSDSIWIYLTGVGTHILKTKPSWDRLIFDQNSYTRKTTFHI